MHYLMHALIRLKNFVSVRCTTKICFSAKNGMQCMCLDSVCIYKASDCAAWCGDHGVSGVCVLCACVECGVNC